MQGMAKIVHTKTCMPGVSAEACLLPPVTACLLAFASTWATAWELPVRRAEVA